MPEAATAIRPTSQTISSASSGAPWSGSRPVQFGIAVKRKPVTTAGVNPNSISCACHTGGAKAFGNVISPKNSGSHSAITIVANSAPQRKNGRKP